MKVLIKEVDTELANVKWFKINATKQAINCGYINCIERQYIYKENNSVIITRHISNTIEGIYEDDDTYYRSFNGHRLSTAKSY